MLRPRKSAAAILLAAALSCALLSASVYAQAQTIGQQETATSSDSKASGLQFYQNKQYAEAVASLKAAIKQKKDDAEAWRYLGLALYRTGDVKGARTALETAAKLNPKDAVALADLSAVLLSLDKRKDAMKRAEQALELDARNAEAHYVKGRVHFLAGEREQALQEAEATLRIDANYAPALLLKTRSLLDGYALEGYSLDGEKRAARQRQLKEAADSLERYLNSTPANSETKFLREQLESLRFYAVFDGKSTSDTEVFSPKEVDVKARILRRPEPQYPSRPRDNHVNGTVILRAVFGADGKVKNILVIESPDKDLTTASMNAARQIKFIPAMKDGKYVAQFIQIEYNFSVF